MRTLLYVLHTPDEELNKHDLWTQIEGRRY